VEVFRGFFVNDGGVVKFAKSSKIHRHLIIKSHQLRWLIKILQVFMVVQNFNKALDKLTIDVHGVLIKPIVKVVSQFLVLGLPVGGIG